MTITALLITHSADTEQRIRIERWATRQASMIDAWLSCDSAHLGDCQWGNDDTVILADAQHCVVNHCASESVKLIENWLGQGVSVVFANTGGQLTKESLQHPVVILRTLADSCQTSRQTIRRREKARAAVKRRQAAGLRVGRTPGVTGRHKLDRHGKTIRKRLGQGVSKSALARQLGVSRSTLYVWLQRQQRD